MEVNDRPTAKLGGALYLPTLAEIEVECARIQAGWTRRERMERAGVNPWFARPTVEVVKLADLELPAAREWSSGG